MFANNPDLFALKEKLKEEVIKVSGVVRGTSRSFGFLNLENDDSIFIRPDDMKRLRHGDLVEGLIKKEGEKSYFLPEKLIKEVEPVFLGLVRRVNDKMCLVEPDHPLDNVWYFLPKSDAVGLDVGDIVKVEMIQHPFNDKPRLRLLKLVAKNNDPCAPWEYSLALNNVPSDSLPGPGSFKFDIENIAKNRRDLRDLSFVTIDSASTKDMDDAVHVSKALNGNLILTVAIADPTEVVDLGSLDDLVAKQRGFTVYLPSKVIPMFPTHYSDNVFSLKEGQDNLCLCVQIEYQSNGDVLKYDFFEGIINSKGKLSYAQVSNWLENVESSEWIPPSDAIAENLLLLKEYYFLRSGWREKNAILYPDMPEHDFLIDNWNVSGIVVNHRLIAHKIIEEAMISANSVAADFLSKSSDKAIYNVNSGFDIDSLDDVEKIAVKINPKYTSEYLKTLDGYLDLRKVLDSGNYDYEDLLIRSFQSRTEFSSTPGVHMGLGFDLYATWTSPIRKYGDTINHRIIKSVLRNEDGLSDLVTEDLLESLSDSLVRQRKSERTVRDWLHNIYLSKEIGNEFSGKVIFINKGGLKVLLNETGHSLFIPKFLFGTKDHPAKINEEKGIIYSVKGEIRLGSMIRFQIDSFDTEHRKINVALINS